MCSPANLMVKKTGICPFLGGGPDLGRQASICVDYGHLCKAFSEILRRSLRRLQTHVHWQFV